MNIFENYLKQINKIILENKDFLNLDNIDNLHDIILEIPPEHFNYDLSTNVCLVLAKANKAPGLFSKFCKIKSPRSKFTIKISKARKIQIIFYKGKRNNT